MKEEDLQPRIPLSELIPAWNDMKLARQALIEAQINQEWWRGYYSGLRAGRGVAVITDTRAATHNPRSTP